MTTKPYVPPDRDTEYRPDQLPPARPWYPHRPAETSADPDAATFGAVGPDMGYARALLGRFRGRLVPGGCNRDDLLEAGAAVAMRRATISGRAPVPEDLEVAFLLLGALDGVPGDWSRAGAKVAEHVEGCATRSPAPPGSRRRFPRTGCCANRVVSAPSSSRSDPTSSTTPSLGTDGVASRARLRRVRVR